MKGISTLCQCWLKKKERKKKKEKKKRDRETDAVQLVSSGEDLHNMACWVNFIHVLPV